MAGSNLSPEARKVLLARIREALKTWLTVKKLRDDDVAELPAELLRPAGAFVTLHKRGRLRGCIGTFQADEPLAVIAVRMGVAAAVQDPRFPPLTVQELNECDIEISVLSPPRPIASPDKIEIGTHGVQLSKGMQRAVFLPQVAPEQGWDRGTMLEHLCLKAGLPAQAWRGGGVDLEVFTAEVFSE